MKRNAGPYGVYAVGGFNIQAHKEVKYFDIQQIESAQNWRRKWFYVSAQQEGLPAFDANAPLVKTRA